MRIIRAGEHIQHIPGYGITVRESGVAVAAANNWWEVAGKTCLVAYQPKGAASYAASLVNLANPGTDDATEGVAPSWDATDGWTFNGSTQYLNTGVGPGVVNAASVFIRYSDAGQGATPHLFGSIRLGQVCGIIPRNSSYGGDTFYTWKDMSIRTSGTEGAVDGIVAGGGVAYRDGSAISSDAPTSGLGMYVFFIGALNDNSGGAINFMPTKVQAYVYYSDSLTAGEAATVSAAMAAL